MRLRDVQIQLAAIHVSIRRHDGEYRVSLMELRGTDREETVAYYTDDLEDALLTGMILRRNANEKSK